MKNVNYFIRKNEKKVVSLYNIKIHLSIKNKYFYFVLHAVFIIFAPQLQNNY